MSKVYTKTGDKGETALVGGTRVSKSDPRIDLYGEVDELNSWIGVCLSHLEERYDEKSKKFLLFLQNRLFDLGSNLACEKDKREEFLLPVLKQHHIKLIEDEIDRMDQDLDPLKNFILPGGHPAASFAHLCRTVCRKLERKMIGCEKEELPNDSIQFINRLSDYFFILSRFINKSEDALETIWKSEKS